MLSISECKKPCITAFSSETVIVKPVDMVEGLYLVKDVYSVNCLRQGFIWFRQRPRAQRISLVAVLCQYMDYTWVRNFSHHYDGNK